MNKRQLIMHFGRFVIGGVFLYSGITKLLDLDGFTQSILNYQLLPIDIIPASATVMATLEAICGLALILNAFTAASALVVNILLIVFICAVTSALIRGLDINCGCFSSDPDAFSSLKETFFRDFAMLIISVKLFFHHKNEIE